jgi:hypothetical protein
MPRPIIATLVAIVAAGTVSALADNAPPEQIVPKHAPPGITSSDPGTTPSGRLSQSGGVIQPPPATDPGIRAQPPVPDTHTGMVVAPPGTPGGDPDVVPK